MAKENFGQAMLKFTAYLKAILKAKAMLKLTQM